VRKYILPGLVGVLTFLLCILTASVVWAQGDSAAPAADPNIATRISELAFQVLTPIITAFAMWATHRLIAVFEKKTKIDIPAAQEEMIDKWIEQAIHYATEQSYKKVAGKAAKLTGPEKLEQAVGFVLAFAQAQGWVQWTKDKLANKIEARLGVHRANGGVPATDAVAAPA